jgi:hypothetical protein
MPRVQIEIAKANLEPLLEHFEIPLTRNKWMQWKESPPNQQAKPPSPSSWSTPPQKQNGRRHRRRPLLFPNQPLNRTEPQPAEDRNPPTPGATNGATEQETTLRTGYW